MSTEFMNIIEFLERDRGVDKEILFTAIEQLRDEGYKVGLIRPITLFPFPSKKIEELSKKAKSIMVMELSNGQMLDDVKLSVGKDYPVEFYCRCGGLVPPVSEVADKIREVCKKYL